MKIKTISELKKALEVPSFKGPIAIFGQEKYLIRESIKTVYKGVRNFPELNIVTMDNDSLNQDNIINAFESLPFMEERKIIHIKNPDFLKRPGLGIEGGGSKASGSGEIMELIIKYVSDTTDEILLLVTFEGEADTRNRLLSSIGSHGILVEYSWLKGMELQKWVEDTFALRGKTISKADLAYFTSILSPSMEQIELEIEKLVAFCQENSVIGRNDIDVAVNRNLESNIFKMVDSISRKDAENAISILNVLLFQKEEYLKIIGLIIRQFRLVLLIKLNSGKKLPPETIMKNLGISDYVYKNLYKTSLGYDEKSLKKALSICLDFDYRVKSFKMVPNLALEMLVVELCK